MTRDLCRSFGRYRRYLGRLRQNLRETQKFFRDLQGSHSHSCPSSPTGGGGAQRAPAGDVAETGWTAGKEGSGQGDRAGEAGRPGGRGTAPLPCKTTRGEVDGRRAAGPARGPAPAEREMPREGIAPGALGQGRPQAGARGAGPGGPGLRGRERAGRVFGEGGD